ncbi:MAG: ribonuclease HII [Oscillospiraceae bacterium]|nr:ribonuclease HII [Oscillospiraceae bacterium]
MNNHLYNFDRAFAEKYESGVVIAGIDEAGRGCLAGDVFAAAVILPDECTIIGIDDSKKLSAKKREFLYDEIIAQSKSYAIATATVEEIEEINILQAALLAMKRAYEALKLTVPHIVLVDGNAEPKLTNNHQLPIVNCIISGDAKSSSIAAASVLAKVARDRYMVELDKQYPEYQFSKHKGYGTKLHKELILKHGITPVHRKSFLKKII